MNEVITDLYYDDRPTGLMLVQLASDVAPLSGHFRAPYQLVVRKPIGSGPLTPYVQAAVNERPQDGQRPPIPVKARTSPITRPMAERMGFRFAHALQDRAGLPGLRILELRRLP